LKQNDRLERSVDVGMISGGRAIDVRWRVVTYLTTFPMATELTAALSDLGYEIDSILTPAELVGSVAVDRPTVVVIHNGHHDWLRIVADLLRIRPLARTVLLAEISAAEEFLAAISAGVAGFCRPDAGVDAIVRTIESVRESGVAIPRSMVAPMVDQLRNGRGHRIHSAAGPIDVTDREWQIVQLMLQRRSTREIADELFVSVGTVRTHISTIVHKLGALDRDDAVALIERGH
jgi:DNA-binding NarL/FixJ family response regulator